MTIDAIYTGAAMQTIIEMVGKNAEFKGSESLWWCEKTTGTPVICAEHADFLFPNKCEEGKYANLVISEKLAVDEEKTDGSIPVGIHPKRGWNFRKRWTLRMSTFVKDWIANYYYTYPGEEAVWLNIALVPVKVNELVSV